MLTRPSSFTNKLKRLRFALAKTPTRFVGVDIGMRCVTVVSLSSNGDSNHGDTTSGPVHWRSHHRIPLDIDPMKPPTPQWIESTIIALSQRLPRCVNGEHNVVSLSLPLSWVHYQVVLGTDLESSQSQCDTMFGGSIFNSAAHLSNWPVVGLQHGMPNQDDQYVVAAVAEDAAFQVATTIGDLGYHVDSIVPHGVAIIEAANALTSVTPRAIALLNREGGLVAVNHSTGCGLCRNLPTISANVLRQSIDYPITIDDIRPWLSDIAAEITATIRYSGHANMTGCREEPLMICGDLARVPGIDVVLAKLTNLPVATWAYTQPVRPNRRLGYSHETFQSNGDLFDNDAECALAISLAYRAAAARSCPE